MGCGGYASQCVGQVKIWFEELEPNMQKHSKAFGWSMTRSMHKIKQCDIRRLASLHNIMIQI
jgi:hypothetical protein